MGLINEADECVTDCQLLSDFSSLHDRRIETGSSERITEPLFQPLQHIGPRVERHGPAALRDGAKLVDPMAMIGMVVRDDDAIEVPNAGIQQLLADIGPAVDEEPLSGDLDQQSAPSPAVFRLVGVALAPIRADPRNAGRRSAAEDRQLQLGLALLNSR